MPYDPRRICGPDVTNPPSKFAEEGDSKPLNVEGNKRQDGRQPENMRPICE